MTEDPNIRIMREAMAEYDQHAARLRERIRQVTQEVNQSLQPEPRRRHAFNASGKN